jgi:flavin-dependent dehydrogenase
LWRIELEGEREINASVVIDATGRSAWLLRQQGERPRRDDELVADARWFQHDHDESSTSGSLVESIPDGWWYSATLPGQRGVAILMTDRDLRTATSWDDRLAAAPATSARLQSWRPTGQAVIRAAHSQCSEVVAGDGWVAAGDAAAAFDPISSLGIGFSLRSGIEAARVAVAFVEKDAATATGYAASVLRIYADYRQRLEGIYKLEQRWPNHSFWVRRQKQ